MMGGTLCLLYWSEALDGVKIELMMGGRKGSRERERRWGMIEGEREQGWERTGGSTMNSALMKLYRCVETNKINC